MLVSEINKSHSQPKKERIWKIHVLKPGAVLGAKRLLTPVLVKDLECLFATWLTGNFTLCWRHYLYSRWARISATRRDGAAACQELVHAPGEISAFSTFVVCRTASPNRQITLFIYSHVCEDVLGLLKLQVWEAQLVRIWYWWQF